MRTGHTMLLAYDGTDFAAEALASAARLLRPATVEILTAWEPAAQQAARSVFRAGIQPVGASEASESDPAYEEAQRVCSEGIQRAEALGLNARAHLVESATTVPAAIVEAAAELNVDVIVTGTRAVSGVRSLWTNSTAEYLIRHADCPVFVVPPVEADDPRDDATRGDTGAEVSG